MFFNDDGTIRKVIPTLRGVGLVESNSEIQIDRYSAISPQGITVSFLDEANPYLGWKASFKEAKSWVQFNEVDFGRGAEKSVQVRAKASGKGALEIHLDKQDGPLVGRVELRPSNEWKVASVRAKNIPAGVHNLVVTQTAGEGVEVDWVSFK